MYDVIVVGARVAGSPVGMLLARAGYSVLIVDRDEFPSDTMSTHFVHPWGLARLQRWGLLDALLATGCPTFPNIRLQAGSFVMPRPVEPTDGVTVACAPRRTVLDALLVEAAREAGAEVRGRFSVREVLVEDGRVVGIRGRNADGSDVEERARIVVGADGLHSAVARAAGAATYNEQPTLTCGYFAYFEDVPAEMAEIYHDEGCIALLFPTHDGQSCIAVQRPRAEFITMRADIEGGFFAVLDRFGNLGDRVRRGHRVTRWQGAGDLPNQFRVPYGPGWALVGDAGYYKDPITGTGISDAFRDAELLASALERGLSGAKPMEEALAGYQRARDSEAMPLYQQTLFLATLPSPERLAAGMRASAAASV